MLQQSNNQSTPTPLIVLSGILGLFIFFLNPNLTSSFISTDKSFEWYAIFSQEIFQPNFSYIAESILLPLLAKVVGANSSEQAYRLLCAVITIMLLPSLTTAVWRVFNDITKTLITVLIFAFSFRYLWAYQLGFPDPLTILLLVLTATKRDSGPIFFSIFVAALSHFSMSAVGGAALIVLYFCSPDGFANKQQQSRAIKSVLMGLIAGRIFLSIWYFLFDYSLNTRFTIVFEHGLGFFFDRYNSAIQEFWLTPGINFLLVCLALFTYFLYKKAYLLLVGLSVALSLAYTALFLTTDGLRVFAVVMSAAYTWTIQMFVQSLSQSRLSVFSELPLVAKRALKAQAFYTVVGALVATAWCVALYKAKSKGLFVNAPVLMMNLIGDIRVFEGGLLCLGALVLSTIAFSSWRSNLIMAFSIKILIVAPLFFIAMQFIRQIISPNEALPRVVLAISMIVIFGLAVLFARVKILRQLEQLKPFALRLVRW
jgi:hypothetical protein